MSEEFFNEPLEQSKVKSQIVVKYFDAWARIIARYAENIAYVDLFAGQGYYENGTESTPLLILKEAIANKEIAKKLTTEFNDRNPEYVKSLQRAINKIQGIEKLPSAPKIFNLTVSSEIVRRYEKTKLPPTLFFLDPWGYKGLSLDLIRASIKDWGCECLFYFNYNRINMSLEIPVVQKDIDVLFGKDRADALRKRISRLCPYEREVAIVNELCKALEEMGGEYVLPFCFKDASKERTSHYIIFVSKDARGYGLMKEIMAGYSREDSDGVPSFTFDPKTESQLKFTFNRPLLELKDSLMKTFRGQTLSVETIYNNHQKQTRFIRKNYTKSLKILEKEGKISVDQPPEKRIRKGEVTLGPKRLITFHE